MSPERLFLAGLWRYQHDDRLTSRKIMSAKTDAI
jgi:hypothetical protein